MSKTQAWLKAMRLRTLPLSVSGIILGSAIAYYQGFWNPIIFSFALATTILFQILSNLANDLGDSIKGTDNENRVGPERTVQSGAITRSQMKAAIVICSILGLASAGVLIYFSAEGMTMNTIWTYIGLALLATLAAITYTVGKKAYGYHGLGDLMVLIFFGFVSVLGVYTLYSKVFMIDNILAAICIGLLSTAVLNLNNMRDFKNDSDSKKMTIVVKMGPNQAKFYHALIILVGLSSMTVFISRIGNPIYFISLLPGLYLIYHLRVVMQTANPADFDPELKKVALATFAISSLFFIAVLIDKFWAI
jgi:1,4-dihydroxy-2-naphthoate octaprenyltransferase